MTTAATVAGHFPLILASGPGAGARNSIGWIVVTGMIIGSAFTLFIVPTFYLLLARNRAGMREGSTPFTGPSLGENAEKDLPEPELAGV